MNHSRGRVAALSDGIFAFASTLMAVFILERNTKGCFHRY
ncbi:DUF1211 domain-containing protein [Winogradskyella sp. D23]|uniref:DUF1211 domain-containing protein n=1 Tax=Winogradskyella alexanderae TaxID=2877123 RepID=A0ABS7XTL7_9FLAO|nr:DUF1211 domain-containing protein [Winogradskyella alexanderae]MCA0132176.1 DUF1211 domain-containing protein [Winogradskyella alexanderae]